MSMSDPLPAIKLEIDCLERKTEELVTLLQNKLLVSIMEEVSAVLDKGTKGREVNALTVLHYNYMNVY